MHAACLVISVIVIKLTIMISMPPNTQRGFTATTIVVVWNNWKMG